jgi:hypothetical protein
VTSGLISLKDTAKIRRLVSTNLYGRVCFVEFVNLTLVVEGFSINLQFPLENFSNTSSVEAGWPSQISPAFVS